MNLTKKHRSPVFLSSDGFRSFSILLNRSIRAYSLLLWLLLAATLPSCKKILNVVSPNQVADGDVFASVAGLRNARIGMYSTLQNKNYYGGYFPLLVDAYTDNGTTGGYDVIDLNDIAARTVNPSNLYVQNTYAAIYNSIYTANKIIGNIGKVPGLADDEKSNTLSEALFVRALGHFDLLRLFGQHWDPTSRYGIPLATSPDSPKVAVPRSTVAASYQQIIADLMAAISGFNTYNGNQYASLSAAKALLARVYLYYGDNTNAATLATDVLNDSNFGLFGAGDFTKIYTEKETKESVFELVFDQQNQSAYNTATYARPDALRSEIFFLAAAGLNTFFQGRTGDGRSALVDFVNVDVSIQPDGRTQKYRGETTKDNSAYIIRLAEIYLIRAEAAGVTAGLADLNTLRTSRGMSTLAPSDVPDDATWQQALSDERRAELNFEGHRLFDLARKGKVEEVLGTGVQPVMPIPQREVAATNGIVEQNPGY